VFEKKRLWHAAVDNFLVAYNDATSGTPEGFVLLDQYRISLGTLVNGQLCIVLTPHSDSPFQFSRSKPHIYVGGNDNSTRQWFNIISAKSCYNIRTTVFSKSVDELVRRQGETSLVPAFVQFACRSLYHRALDNGTLFSAPVNSQLLDKMRSTIDGGGFPELQDSNDDIALAQLLVSFLAEMPEGLIPNDMLPQVWKFAFGGKATDDSTISGLNTIIQNLPLCNAATLRYVLEFFAIWLEQSGTREDPGVILGPLFLRIPEEGASVLYQPKIVVDVAGTIVKDFLSHLDELTFPAAVEGFNTYIATHPPLAPPQPPVVPLSLFHHHERTLMLDAVMTARPLPSFESSSSGRRQAAANMISQYAGLRLSTAISTNRQYAANSVSIPAIPASSNSMISPRPTAPVGTSPSPTVGVPVSSVAVPSSPSPSSPVVNSTAPATGVSSQGKSGLSMDLSIDGEITFKRKHVPPSVPPPIAPYHQPMHPQQPPA